MQIVYFLINIGYDVMRTITVRQIDLKNNCKHFALHKFKFPEYNDPEFYRSSISFSAFFESAKGRNRSERFQFTEIKEDSLQQKEDLYLPVVYHKNLKSFFQSIGYDQKKQKIVKF